mmetsp:Transcript_22752/g.38946  ORF Transcript_22752/g.38946 Transcript_22752/m.38946 type:complete len:250 (+) Transcript_22752:156-905(+)|eukprot:CAMPEP_0183738642 /NCGR_PEP_ID=MMETSP0737-20130205/55098_1 /TAXON_ID=385413 /ORGANISM="Thalassiosira miniscula, Strain CCMP1093" /LENGTH=249 /DNA_ID=CAMNT_0025973221 /DNA_START=77 /DNA_END=826 /DNA_ORIENTATION=+
MKRALGKLNDNEQRSNLSHQYSLCQDKGMEQRRRNSDPPCRCTDKQGKSFYSHNGPALSKKGTTVTAKRAAVSFAPLPPTSFKKTQRKNWSTLTEKGFRSDYSLGDTIRTPCHMVEHPDSEQAFQAVNSLKKHDFAFIKRSDGSYTYAILAFRSLELPDNGSNTGTVDSLDEYMGFVMCNNGSVKMVKRKQWVEFIRPVAVESLKNVPDSKSPKPKHTKDDSWVPPSIISFIAANNEDEDLSLSTDHTW